jgi:uncharacterized membrane protein
MSKSSRPSVTYTALIWLGILLVLIGLVVTLLGVGGAVTFDAKINDIEFHTTNLGLAILMVGAVLAALVAIKLPKGVEVFAVQRRTFLDRVAANSGWITLCALLAIILFVAAWIRR